MRKGEPILLSVGALKAAIILPARSCAFGIGQVEGPVDGHEQAVFTRTGPGFGDVDIDIPNRASRELLLRFVAFDL